MRRQLDGRMESTMNEIVLIAGIKYKEAAETAEFFRGQGDTVYALSCADDKSGLESVLKEIQAEGKLDYLIIQSEERGQNIHPVGSGNLDYEDIAKTYDTNVGATFELVEAMLPLLKQGKKRLGLITSAATSIRCVKETEDFGYAMAQASLHMMWKQYFNKLRPEGFTFRCFCPNADGSGISAGGYMQMDFCYDPGEPYTHSEENFIVMRDGWFREIPW